MSSNGRDPEGRDTGSGGTGAGASSFDRALRDWPEASSAAEGEGKARLERVVARIEAIDAGGAAGGELASAPSDDELFGSPLPRSAEDAEAPTTAAASSRERLRERQNLKDLAKLARSKEFDAPAERDAEPPTSHRAGEARGDDSGIIHLATATKSEPVGVAKPSPAPAPEATPEPAHAPAATAEPATKPRRARAGMVLALYATTTVALASAAAAVFLFVRTREAAPLTVAAAPDPRTTETAAPEPRTAETPPPPPSASALALGTDPNSLPPATAPGAPRAPGKTTPPASEPASPKVEARPLASVAARDGRPTDLGSAIQREVGSDKRPRDTRPRDTQEKTPAAAITGAGDVPQRPSQGAITGAIGGVLPDARRCLGPDDPVSHAAIVFASSGSVQSVTVSGPATGKPTEACIKDALSKAKVPPFAEPTSTANITIRHL